MTVDVTAETIVKQLKDGNDLLMYHLKRKRGVKAAEGIVKRAFEPKMGLTIISRRQEARAVFASLRAGIDSLHLLSLTPEFQEFYFLLFNFKLHKPNPNPNCFAVNAHRWLQHGTRFHYSLFMSPGEICLRYGYRQSWDQKDDGKVTYSIMFDEAQDNLSILTGTPYLEKCFKFLQACGEMSFAQHHLLVAIRKEMAKF